MPKVFFYDLGLRNALINNFEHISARGDAGQLFENFIVTELLKYNYYGNFGYSLNYRTKGGSKWICVEQAGSRYYSSRDKK